MSKSVIIAVFAALLILCVGAQVFSLNRSDHRERLTKNYFYVR